MGAALALVFVPAQGQAQCMGGQRRGRLPQGNPLMGLQQQPGLLTTGQPGNSLTAQRQQLTLLMALRRQQQLTTSLTSLQQLQQNALLSALQQRQLQTYLPTAVLQLQQQNALLVALQQAQQQTGLLSLLQWRQLIALQQQQAGLLTSLQQQSSALTQQPGLLGFFP